MKIKTGDTVIVLSGKNLGKKGKVIQTFPREDRVVVEGVNKVIKHMRRQSREQKGQKIEFFGPIAASRVSLICPHCGKASRIGYSGEGENKKRICKKCKEAVK